jgi:hypothetical protein
VPHYHKLRALGVYAGIDLVYYGDGGKLEYDFVVEPGADPNRIRLAYAGAEAARYSTYLSSSGMNRASSIAAESTSAAYVTGHTNSTNFLTTTGAYQTGESKIEIPVAARTITAWTVPLTAQLDARNSRENLCNGF